MQKLADIFLISLAYITRLKQILVQQLPNANFVLLNSSLDCLRISVIWYKYYYF